MPGGLAWLISWLGWLLVAFPGRAEPLPETPLPMAPPRLAVRAAAAPALGVWLTTVDSRVLYDASEGQRALAFLRHNGFRRAALPLYTAGVVTWSPDGARNRLGIGTDPLLLPAVGRPGPTASLLGALGRGGLERVGWFEFGLMAPVAAPWLVGRDGLLLRDAKGSTLWSEGPGLDRVWLNPLLPQVRQLLVDLVLDACTRLPVDVI